MLDAENRAAFVAAVSARSPVLGQTGFAPSQVLLRRPPGSGRLYVSLRPVPTGAPCFDATFSAQALPMTPRLLKRYASAI